MEETFSSLVCFQPPPHLWSQFTLCSLKDPNTQMSRAGLQSSAEPRLGGCGGRQSWWVLDGKAKKKNQKKNLGASRACAQKHVGVHTPKMLWVHLCMQHRVTSSASEGEFV